MLSTAIAIAAKTFEGRKDKGGKPYILHCLAVMYGVKSDDEELNCIAVLHDVPEDDGRDSEEVLTMLEHRGMTPRVIKALRLLTHDKTTPYDEYIKALAHNKDCVEVKKADLEHNSQITRLKGLTKKDLDNMEKYHRSYVYLSKL